MKNIILSIWIIFILSFSPFLEAAVANSGMSNLQTQWDENNKQLTISNPSNPILRFFHLIPDPTLLTIRQLSLTSDLCDFEEIFEIKPVKEDYITGDMDFLLSYKPSNDKILSERWFILTERGWEELILPFKFNKGGNYQIKLILTKRAVAYEDNIQIIPTFLGYGYRPKR